MTTEHISADRIQVRRGDPGADTGDHLLASLGDDPPRSPQTLEFLIVVDRHSRRVPNPLSRAT